MTDQATWQDELDRQRQRLDADLVSRQLGVALTAVVFSFFLSFWLVFTCYVVNVCTEALQRKLMLAHSAHPTPRLRTAILANAALGMSAYCLPAIFVWLDPNPLVKFTGALSLVGALLSVSVVRSVHLVFGIVSGLPAALALLWLPSQYLFDPVIDVHATLAVAGVVILIGYFASALLQNHRDHQSLVAAVAAVSRASLAKSQYLTAMSHEMRTPLNAILGHSQLLGEAEDPRRIHDLAAEITTAARGMQTIVEDVIDLSSASEGQLLFRPVTAVIRPELEVIATLPLPIDLSHRPELNVEIAPEVPEFGRFDPILLRKCLTHLCAFILNETCRGRTTAIDMRCALAPGRRDRLRITISGQGPDNPEADHREDPSEDTLALKLVHSVAEVMGGRAMLLTALDGAVLARIEIPFVTVPEPPDTGAETVYGRLRALVVDDIATNRFVIVQMLRALRIEADEAEGGASAIERLAEGEFDLVLLDMNMPDMDGEATFREIRSADAPWAGIPVIALTADAVAMKRDYYLSLGLDGFVSKPVDRRLLWAEILGAVPPPPPL